MRSMTESTTTKKSIFRKNFLFFLLTVSVITYSYFYFFFDSNLRKVISSTLTTINGATVDMKDLRTSFTKGTLQIKNLGFTDKDNLSSNLLYFPKINFELDISGLLQGKIVINDIAFNDFTGTGVFH